MKKKLKWFLPILLIIIIRFCLSLTPEGSIRFTLIKYGHPIQAFTTTMEFKDIPYNGYTKNNEQMVTFINPPYAKETGTEMYNWVVKKVWIFYFAKYYGW